MKKAIGFNRFIRRAWLDQAATVRQEIHDIPTLRIALHKMLEGRVAGESARGARTKSVGVLTRIWSPTDIVLAGERDDALALMRIVARDEWIVFHWFLTCATYPFFEDVAILVGRLMKLQGQVAAKEIMERLSKTYGERETVHRCLQYVLRSMVEWRVLQDQDRGTYTPGRRTTIDDGRILSWSIKCRMQGRNAAGLYESSLKQDPASFPFEFGTRAWDDVSELHASPQGRDIFYQRLSPATK